MNGISLTASHHSASLLLSAIDCCGFAMPTSSSKSRSGYVITYHGCSILWSSKLQGESALSTTESEILALSAATREKVPLMWLLQEIADKGLINSAAALKVHCKIFEDNSGAEELATVPKQAPKVHTGMVVSFCIRARRSKRKAKGRDDQYHQSLIQ